MKQIVVMIWTLVIILTVYAGYLFVKKCPQGFSVSEYILQRNKPDLSRDQISQKSELDSIELSIKQ